MIVLGHRGRLVLGGGGGSGTDATDVAGGTYVEIWAATTDTSVSSGLTVEVLAIRARGAAPL